jgi:acetyl-CoA C-acetyltransferase
LSKIRVIQPFVGGGFGGTKNDSVAADFCAVLFSKRLGKPVKYQYSMEEVFTTCRRRHNFSIVAKMGMKKDGTITAAASSSINDGASAVVVMSLDKARELGLKPLAKLVGICNAGIDAMVMGLGPAVAIPKCLKQAGLSFNDIEYWEVNEAFAAQWLGVGRMLKEEHNVSLSTENCNFNGSGIALGHPVGSTGLRIVVSLCYELERQGKTLGGASLCVGTGPAMASLWSRDI